VLERERERERERESDILTSPVQENSGEQSRSCQWWIYVECEEDEEMMRGRRGVEETKLKRHDLEEMMRGRRGVFPRVWLYVA
jgi:hypothetical protein